MIKPSLVQEIEFFHNNKRLVAKIIPGGYSRNKAVVEKMYGWHVANSFGKAWDRIFGPKPTKAKLQAHVDKAVPGTDQTSKVVCQNTKEGIIINSTEVVPAGTENSSLTIGENHG